MVALIGHVMLLLAVVLLVMKVMVLLMMRVGRGRGCLARGRVGQRPDFRLGRGYRHACRAAVGFDDPLVLEVVLAGVCLMVVVVVLHRVVKRMLAPAGILLEIEVVLLVQVLVVLQVLRFHVPHRLCKQTASQFSKLAARSGVVSSRNDRGKTVLLLSLINYHE